MRIPHIIPISALVLATTGFYTYVGQMVPQKEVQPPKETALGGDMSTADMAKIGREIMEGKGICLTCHTIGKSGALRFPDLAGIGGKAGSRVPGLSDVEYLAQSLYEPFAFVVPGFPPAMPPVNQPPIGLTDQEILCVIAALQTLGGTPTVTLKTTHKYYDGKPKPGAAPAAPATGAHLLQPAHAPGSFVARAELTYAGGAHGRSLAEARQGTALAGVDGRSLAVARRSEAAAGEGGRSRAVARPGEALAGEGGGDR